jgi:hypothetical protein
MTAPEPSALRLVGCGILSREIRSLAEKNHWPLRCRFLDSALHCDLERLERTLTAELAGGSPGGTVVFYGCCHPRMDQLLRAAGTFRTEGQNCLSMLLGEERFAQELERGAFFLLEGWAYRWERIVARSLGTDDPHIIQDIFRGDRKFLLGVRTPCSRDFGDAAEAAARFVGLPLAWADTGLEHLERVLAGAVARGAGGAA